MKRIKYHNNNRTGNVIEHLYSTPPRYLLRSALHWPIWCQMSS